jgi:penicillin-binding protein 1C
MDWPLRRLLVLRRLKRWGFASLLMMVVLLATHEWWLGVIPLPKALFEPPLPSVEIVDCTGLPLREVPEGKQPFTRRVGLREIPPVLVEATLAAEDKRFRWHHGVDWRATLRAAFDCVRCGRIVSGASTITQQLVKLSEPRPRTLWTKLIEALQAMRLEQVWSKERIMEEYLNRLDYGSFTRGTAEAAAFYFGKAVLDLSPAEAAFLAGLPQAPTRFNPVQHMERARKRQHWVLGRMFGNHFLARSEYERAVQEPIQLWKARRPFAAPHFVDLLAQQKPDFAVRGGPIQTTVDLRLNRFAEKTLRDNLRRLQDQHAQNGAVVVIENRTGNILALVGSEDYFDLQHGQVNGAWAPRSSGSTLKPFIYLLAFEEGATPASIVPDLPAEFPTATGVFEPVNYDHRAYGPMRYRLALGNSLNISAVKVLASVGGAPILKDTLQKCGVGTLSHEADFYGLGLAIGNAEVRLLELANAYACLARLGTYKPCNLQPANITGKQIEGRRVFASDTAYLLADVLADPAARALSFGLDSYLDFAFPVACKTGTSSDFRDNWAIGYTPEFTVGVWVGNFDGSPMQSVSGVTGAGPILHDIFEHLHSDYGTTWYPQPANIVEKSVDPLTGKLAATERPTLVREKFLTQALPPRESPSDYDVKGRVLLSREYANWARSADNWLGNQRVALAEPISGEPGLQVISPVPGTVFFIDPDLPGQGRRVRLQALGAKPEWKSDTLPVVKDGNETFTLLQEGTHRFTVRESETGQVRETWIEVKGL